VRSRWSRQLSLEAETAHTILRATSQRETPTSMSRTATFKVVTDSPKEVWVACGPCSKVTCHRVLADVVQSDASPDETIEVWNNYMTVLCQGCRTISYCHESRCSEDWQWNEEKGGEELLPEMRLYPNRIAGRAELEGRYELPLGIWRIYRETHAALCSDLPILAGVGIRAIIETVCREKSAKGRNLVEQIDDLVSIGLITKDGASILHSLRGMGNKAAHEVKANSETNLGIAFDVLEHLLRGVYILPQRAAQL
jgi:hypothetical protein